MTWLIFGLFFIAIVMLVLSFARSQSLEDASARLSYLKERQQRPGTDSLEASKAPRKAPKAQALAPVAQKLVSARFGSVLRQKLDHAGKRHVQVEQYAVYILLCMVGFPVGFYALNVALLQYSNDVLLYMIPALIGLGYFYPLIRLNSEVERRQQAIFRAFPDFVDLLTVCLEAGMGLDAALNLVAKKAQPSPLRDELDYTIQQIRVGQSRGEALKDLARRLDMREVTSFVVAVVQAEQIGTSLSNILKIQSEISRDARWQKAQELAQKAPIKMLFPMILLIFPNIFLIIFGPLVLEYMSGR